MAAGDSYTERLERSLGALVAALEQALGDGTPLELQDALGSARALLASRQPKPFSDAEIAEFRRWHLELRLKNNPDDPHEPPETCRCSIAEVIRNAERVRS